MAAPENVIVGVDLKLQYDTTTDGTDNPTLIGTQTGGTLSLSPDQRDILLKNEAGGTATDYKGRLSGNKTWEVSHEGLVLNGSDEYHIANGNASLKLKVDITDDGTENPEFVEVPRLESIDFTLTQEIAETGGLDRELWRYIRPAEREFSIDISGSYVDPASDLGALYDELWAAMVNGTRLPAKLTVYDKTFEGDVAIGDFSLEGATGGEDASIDLSLASDGALTIGGTAFGSGVEGIFKAFDNQHSVGVAMLHYSGGSPNSGATKFTGSGYFSEVSLSITDGEEITTSTSLQGDGKITKEPIP